MKFGLRETVFLALLMLIPVGAWWFVFRPQNALNAKMRSQIESRQAKLRELNKSMTTIKDLKKQIGELTKAIDFFQSKLPKEKEIDKILQDIWRLAKDNDLHTESIRALVRSDKTSFVGEDAPQGEQPIAVHLSGDFMGFYGFLQALENQPRIMRIRKMTVETKKNAPKGHVEAEFEMSIFFDQNSEVEPWPMKVPT